MKIGYPCINTSIGCTANSTFRLKSYSEKRLISAVQNNLDCLLKILEYNVNHGLLFFRIGSDLVPFASHPICRFGWEKYFKKQFKHIGSFIKKHKIRISMHPDQFTLINSPSRQITKRSIKELEYHRRILDAMCLGTEAKIQIHVGGVYGNKARAIESFVKRYKSLDRKIKNRLVIENDDISYSLKDCLKINQRTKIPVVLDAYHHQILNNGESIRDALIKAKKTWKKKDGLLMVDYSSGRRGKRTHAEHININDFKKFIEKTKGLNFDMMLEIKDKEKSALKAAALLKNEK